MSDVVKKVSEKVENHPKRKAALKIIARMALKEGMYQGKVVKALMKQLSMSYSLGYYYLKVSGVNLPKHAPKTDESATETLVPDENVPEQYVNGLDVGETDTLTPIPF